MPGGGGLPTLRRMYRIIGGDGREYGPVYPEQIQNWIAQRRADAGTLAKGVDATDWTPLGQLPEFAADFAALNAPPALPPPLPADAPGAGDAETAANSAADARDAAAYIGNCLGRPYRVSIGAAISRGYDLVAKQFWLALGAVLMVTGVHVAIALVPFVGIANLALEGVFDAGLSFFFLAVARSGAATLGDAFAGFRVQFGQLVLFSLVRTCAFFSAFAVAVFPVAIALGVAVALQNPHAPPGPGFFLFLLVLPLLMIPLFYLAVSWTFAPFLVIDRGLGFWDAMELSRQVVGKRWFKFAFLHLAFVPIHFAGLLTFGVGLIYTTALQRATFAGIYEDVFRE